MVHRARASHIGGCLSLADLLAVLYGDFLRMDTSDPTHPARDRCIVSKGHASAAVYATLAHVGFFPLSLLERFSTDGSHLPGHVTRWVPGIELSTGSLGHGLSFGCGVALAGRRDRAGYRVVVLMSDGEMDAGSVWEAALFAPHHRLNNLVAIVDYNKIQSFGRTKEVLDLDRGGTLAEKWRSFGWAVHEIDGHDHGQILGSLNAVNGEAERPTAIIAHTVKGKGVDFMEDQLVFHYRPPTDEELERALAQVER